MAKTHHYEVPSLSSVSTQYAALLARKTDLQAKKQRLDRESDELRYAQTTFRPDGGRTARIGALLGDDIADIVDPTSRLAEIAIEIADIEAALREISARLSAERNVASKVITSQVRTVYQAKVAALARGLIAAHEAHRDLLGIINDLNAADVAWTGDLPPMQAVRVIGEPRDNQSTLARYVQEAASLGFIKATEIPVELV